MMGTLSGTFVRPSGESARGSVMFTLTARVADPPGDRIVVEGPVVAELDATGKFTVPLRPTDDPDLAATGLSYTVVEAVDYRPKRTYTILLPAPGPWRLEDLVGYDLPPGVAYLPLPGIPGPEGPQGPAGPQGPPGEGGLDQATADTLYVNVTGDTIRSTSSVAPELLFDAAYPTGETYARLKFLRRGLLRWAFGKNSAPEFGSNVGSDLVVQRYDDGGNFLSYPLVIQRATGNVQINSGGVTPERTSPHMEFGRAAGSGHPKVFVNTHNGGSPEGSVTAYPGSLFIDANQTTGGLWVKETGVNTNTGWRKVVLA